MTDATMADQQIESQRWKDYRTYLHPHLKQIIVSGPMLIAVKRVIAIPRIPSVVYWLSVGTAQQNAALHHKLDVMRQPTSWRVTAPLRAFAQRLRIGDP